MMYLVSEERLLQLLEAEHRLNCLEWDGVDNWSWYMESRKEYLKEAVDGRIPEEDINEDFDFEDLAKLDLEGFEKSD